MSKIKLIAALALVSGAAVGAYEWKASRAADRGQRVVDRIWIDHMPASQTDKINVFLVLSEEAAGQQVGAFQNSSMWAGEHEFFTYDQKGGKLVATFPQTADTEALSAKATRCEQGEMDFCLELDGGTRGVHKYYSRKGWEIEGGSHSLPEVEQRIEQRIEQIEKSAPAR